VPTTRSSVALTGKLTTRSPGIKSASARTAVDLAVPFSPRINTPPRLILTRLSSSPFFIISCPTIAANGNTSEFTFISHPLPGFYAFFVSRFPSYTLRCLNRFPRWKIRRSQQSPDEAVQAAAVSIPLHETLHAKDVAEHFFGDDLLGSAARIHTTGAHHHNFIGASGSMVNVMQNHDNGYAVLPVNVSDKLHNFPVVAHIEISRRFIQ